MLRKFINSQLWLSGKFDLLLPAKFRVDGLQDYVNSLAPRYLGKNLKVYDIGGGKSPYLSNSKKQLLNAYVVGLDIDEEELSGAPEGVYDETITMDVAKYKGDGDADLIFCEALLEHVQDVDAAFATIKSTLKSGGTALIFVPSRNALFARLNLILPETIKKNILYKVFPGTSHHQGFPAYYNKCTPAQFKKLANKHGLEYVEERYYYFSNYFAFFFPVYLLWRVWILIYYTLAGDNAAETFAVALKKG